MISFELFQNYKKLILNSSKVNKIFVIGKKAYQLYYKYIYDNIKIDAILLSSTSPVNANKKLEDLVKEFQIILSSL